MLDNNTTAFKAAVALHASKLLKDIPRKESCQSQVPMRINNSMTLRYHVWRDPHLRTLDRTLKENPRYYGSRLEKYRHEVLLKLYQGMSYYKIVTWLKEDKGFTVSHNTVKNFTISMVEFGFLPKGMEDRLHHSSLRPWDVQEATAILISGWQNGKTAAEIKKQIKGLGVANVLYTYEYVRLKLKAEKGLTARSFKKGLDPYRPEIIEAAKRGDYYSVIGKRYGVGEKTVWRYISLLVKEGALPLYYQPKRKLSMHRPFIKRCVELKVSEKVILRHLKEFYGVTVSQKCLTETIRNLPKIPGL